MKRYTSNELIFDLLNR